MSTYSDGATEQAHVDARLDVAAIQAEALRELAATLDRRASDSSYVRSEEVTETYLDAARVAREAADRLTEGGSDV